jgi:hypothetical protein
MRTWPNQQLHDAAQRMHDRADEFRPEAITEDGEVHVMFLFTDIDKEIDRHEPDVAPPPTPADSYNPPKFRFEVGNITPAELWNDKEKWFDKAKTSRERWKSFGPNEQNVIKDNAKAALAWLYHNDGWEPEVTVKGGNFVSIYFPA